MLIFARERLVFLSVPKTGTTAFAQALAPWGALDLRPLTGHRPPAQFATRLSPATG